MRIWCLRHGESTDNVARMLSASDGPGGPLTDTGRAQAATAAAVLRTERVAAVYSSPALRATQTAEILTGALGIDGPRVTPALLECNVGICEGRSDGAAHQLCYETMRAWIARRDLAARTPGGESGHEVADRVTAALQEVRDRHAGQNVAVVSHVAALTVAVMTLCPDLAPIEVWGHPLPQATPLLLTDSGGRWRVPAWPGRASLLGHQPGAAGGGAGGPEEVTQ